MIAKIEVFTGGRLKVDPDQVISTSAPYCAVVPTWVPAVGKDLLEPSHGITWSGWACTKILAEKPTVDMALNWPDPAIQQFINAHEGLNLDLSESEGGLRRVFGGSLVTERYVARDPDDDSQELVVLIRTQLPRQQARELLNDFGMKFWPQHEASRDILSTQLALD